MGAALTGIGQGLAFAWRYRNELMALGQALFGLWSTLKTMKQNNSRSEKIEQAKKTKNPDDLEKSYRSGNGGA